MKTKILQDLREKSVADLKKELLALETEQFNLRMQTSTGELPKPHYYKKARRNVARIYTILRQRQE